MEDLNMDNKKTENVNKPLILVRQECLNSLINTINESGLPSFIIEPILKDLLNTIQRNMREEYDQTLNWYMKQLQKESQETKRLSKTNDIGLNDYCEDIELSEKE